MLCEAAPALQRLQDRRDGWRFRIARQKPSQQSPMSGVKDNRRRTTRQPGRIEGYHTIAEPIAKTGPPSHELCP